MKSFSSTLKPWDSETKMSAELPMYLSESMSFLHTGKGSSPVAISYMMIPSDQMSEEYE